MDLLIAAGLYLAFGGGLLRDRIVEIATREGLDTDDLDALAMIDAMASASRRDRWRAARYVASTRHLGEDEMAALTPPPALDAAIRAATQPPREML